MKRNAVVLFIISIIFFSCSTDETNNADDIAVDENSIVGSWRATSFRAADPNDSNVNLGAEILANLTAEECYILSFTFSEDLMLTVESAVNFLQINATASGLEVSCPTESETETSTYTFDGTTLTTIDANGETLTVTVTIDGDMLIANATDLDIPNLDGDGELIFERF